MTRHPASESGRFSAAELYENARAEQAPVLAIGGPTAPWQECAVAFQSSYPGIEVAIDGGFSNVLTPKIDEQLSEGKLGVDVAVLQTLQDFARWKRAGQLLRFVPEGWETIDATFKNPDPAHGFLFQHHAELAADLAEFLGRQLSTRRSHGKAHPSLRSRALLVLGQILDRPDTRCPAAQSPYQNAEVPR